MGYLGGYVAPALTSAAPYERAAAQAQARENAAYQRAQSPENGDSELGLLGEWNPVAHRTATDHPTTAI